MDIRSQTTMIGPSRPLISRRSTKWKYSKLLILTSLVYTDSSYVSEGFSIELDRIWLLFVKVSLQEGTDVYCACALFEGRCSRDVLNGAVCAHVNKN